MNKAKKKSSTSIWSLSARSSAALRALRDSSASACSAARSPSKRRRSFVIAVRLIVSSLTRELASAYEFSAFLRARSAYRQGHQSDRQAGRQDEILQEEDKEDLEVITFYC